MYINFHIWHFFLQSTILFFISFIFIPPSLCLSLSDMVRSVCTFQCCVEDNLSVAELLLSRRGVDINAQDDDLWTPLHYACDQDNADLVALLLTVCAS